MIVIIRQTLPQPLAVKGHQVRKQATSWADAAGVDPQTICDAATWKTSSTFARHYQLDLQHGQRSYFGKRILQLSASSSAETSVKHTLATRTARGGGNSNYRIPKLTKKN